jgi:hypothetical protein
MVPAFSLLEDRELTRFLRLLPVYTAGKPITVTVTVT